MSDYLPPGCSTSDTDLDDREEFLEPCPFCGSARGPFTTQATVDGDKGWFEVYCDANGEGVCGARGPAMPTASLAVEAWNRPVEGWNRCAEQARCRPLVEAAREVVAADGDEEVYEALLAVAFALGNLDEAD